MWRKVAAKIPQERKNQGIKNDALALLAELKICSRARDLKRGKKAHAVAVECGHNSNIFVANALISMYAKCSSMVDACQVFDSLEHPTVVSWSALILGYADNGQGQIALELFTRMEIEGLTPHSETFVAALKACSTFLSKEGWAECRDRVKIMANLVIEIGCTSNIYVQNTLVDMYAKCGSMKDAQDVFDSMKQRDVVSWTSLILGYADNGQGYYALDFFTRIENECSANSVTLVAALKACTSLAVEEATIWVECRDKGKALHSIAAGNICESNVYVQSTLVDMYAKLGCMEDARMVFDSMKHPNVVSWTALILGYAESGQGYTALQLFSNMKTEGFVPDYVTIVGALKACISLAVNDKLEECRERSKAIHNLILENGCNSHLHVQSTLMDVYSKCGSIIAARQVFDDIEFPNVVSWNVLILGYAENGQGCTALNLFIRMRTEGPGPNSVTFLAVLKACSLVGALEFGRSIHSEINRRNELDVTLVNCLVDFYAKCGSLDEAQNVFDLHAKTRNMRTWNALLAGFCTCGDNDAAFGLFERMEDAGFRPDAITFLWILTCCSHVGLVEKGKECFDTMASKYGIIPTLYHYTCMIDLFGRANKLDDAMKLLKGMPCNPDNVAWKTILGACWKWENVEIGRLAFQSLVDLNDRSAVGYVLMRQLYASRGMQHEHEIITEFKKKIKFIRGETCWTNEVGEVHTFFVKNSQHPQIHEIHDKWKSMSELMRQHGYVPGLPSITDVELEESICGHSEMVALVCALINTLPGKTVRIVKNLRVCKDCHAAIALISKLEHRTVICRDVSRMHVFKDGKCSCGDFW